MLDVLSYMLIGKMVIEYIIVFIFQMLNLCIKCFEKELLDVVDIKEEQFGCFVFLGEFIGVLIEEVQKIIGLGVILVIVVVGYDIGLVVVVVLV